MKINILGLGWFGEPLGRSLLEKNHTVTGSTRSDKKKEDLSSLHAETLTFPHLPSKNLMDGDAIVLNIPPFVGQLDWFKSWDWEFKTWVIFISSTSKAPLLLEEEKWIQENFSQWTILRFGGLWGGKRHPGKHLSGKTSLKGRLSPVNLLHLDDAIGVTQTVLEKKLSGQIFDVVSDEHPTRENFYTAYCQRENLPLPEFDPEDQSKGPEVSNADIKRYYPRFRTF